MPTAAIIINRTRVRDLPRFRRQCGLAASAAGWEPAFADTSSSDHGLDLARDALAAGAGLVVAAGGDGTVRACAHALAGSGVPLAIVPRGTANLAARALGIPARLDVALAAGFGGRNRRIDLADAGGMLFAAMAGIGLDAAVVSGTPDLLKRHLGWLAYATGGVTRLAGRRRAFTVCLDGGPPLARRARSVVVGNVGLLPGGFALLPDARLDDGLLDVGILAPAGPAAGAWSPGACSPAAATTTRTWNGSGPAGSRSRPTPSCRGRSTGRSSARAGRSRSRCDRARCWSGCLPAAVRLLS